MPCRFSPQATKTRPALRLSGTKNLHFAGAPFPRFSAHAAQLLLEKLADYSIDGNLSADISSSLLETDQDLETILLILRVVFKIPQSALGPFRDILHKIIEQTLDIIPNAQHKFLEISDWINNESPNVPTALVQLVLHILREVSLNTENFSNLVMRLLVELPNDWNDILNLLTEKVFACLPTDENSLRAMAAVKRHLGNREYELYIWNQMVSHQFRLDKNEIARLFNLISSDVHWNIEDKLSQVKAFIGNDLAGEDLVTLIAPAVKELSLPEISLWSDLCEDAPDLWAASWAAWLRSNPAIAHFKGVFIRESSWLNLLVNASSEGRSLLIEYLPEDFIGSLPELRKLIFSELKTPAHIIISSLLTRREVLTTEEHAAIKAFVSDGPDNLKERGVAKCAFSLFAQYAGSAFVNSASGIERWLSFLPQLGVAIDDKLLECFVTAVNSTKLERKLIRIIAKLNLVIDEVSLPEKDKDRLRNKIREVTLCRECNGIGNTKVPCNMCHRLSDVAFKTSGQEACNQCTGSGFLLLPCKTCGSVGVVINADSR